ncbi:uncharacterized protein SPPG_03583 [Spizellomyces punctatus DAOM BR117]|uniref:Uncharacterized protein n=1 Tax=Spizellomyces punctatus (strain DAOM BR117) TaxID=645134 RepID=A0A0L0HKZ5_SPIPD|nr:uncharacterized protein SPPG_03583 [Spizellomyces punctatus DAOM BR117]KND01792.1 hypothetical protein SPPG_03583 [Spizellomyces punctatus DAOM BR117]|eukprot:XP_016609831.1 hypothetical protein SPPG_03583 [Spizellomyces punctatus DAOM BR117]
MTVLPPSPLDLSDRPNLSQTFGPTSPSSSSPEVEKADFVVTTIGNAVADEVRSMRSLTRASKRRSALIFNNAPLELVDSWSEQDLRTKLKDALEALKDKERDLTLAAEIGQQLVAANNSLMTEYQELVNRTKSLQQLNVQAPQYGSRASLRGGSLRSLARRRSKASLSIDLVAASEPSLSSDSPTSTTAPSLSRRRSIGTLEYVNSLERANTDLRAQLDVLEANLRDAERIHRQTVSNLRRNNASLQDQLRATLQDLRDAEAGHARVVSNFERDLDQLRNELQATAQAAAELEVDRRRLLREHAEVRRDTKELEQTDQEIIQDLGRRVKDLETENAKLLVAKKESDRRCAMQRIELEELSVHAKELEAKVAETEGLKDEYARQSRVVDELREQLEDIRASDMEHFEEEMAFGGVTGIDEGDEDEPYQGATVRGVDSGQLTPRKQDWEWTKWIERTRTRCWELDMAGLRDEIADLRAHREEAYSRLRSTLESCTRQVVDHTPRPITSLASMASSVIGTVFGTRKGRN